MRTTAALSNGDQVDRARRSGAEGKAERGFQRVLAATYGDELNVCRIIAATLGAADMEVVDLPGLGVHQHYCTIPAAIINGMGAGDYDGRRRYDRPDLWGFNQL